jgi:outer membrane protein assembly factor BamE
MRFFRFVRPLGLVLAAAGLGGCQSLGGADSLIEKITPYKIDVVQGNVVTRERVQALKPGMSREQVSDIMGTPLLTDMFHANRWDYIFTVRRQGEPFLQKAVVLKFDGDKLKTIDAPELPSENEFVAQIDPVKKPAKLPQLALTAEQRAALPVPPKPAVEAPAKPSKPTRSYPPLEGNP